MYPKGGHIGCLALLVVCFLGEVYTKNVDNNRAKRTADDGSCENVRQFFSLKNVTIARTAAKGSICNGQCCDDKTEALLRKQSQRDFADLLRHNSRSLQGLLISTATTLQNHMSELTRQSENKTLLLFAQVYRGMSTVASAPIKKLYQVILDYARADAAEVDPQAIATSVALFFTELFPLAYHHSADISDKDFTPDYKECLKKSMEIVAPFGESPQQVAQSLAKSLEATRLLLQAFRIGSEVLNTTDSLLIDGNATCHAALVRLTYCPRCSGVIGRAKPCSGLCLNVLRGCLARYVAELDPPWNGFVEGVERLLGAMTRGGEAAGVNADAVVRGLDARISAAIMHHMANGKEIDAKVKKHCGPAEFSPRQDAPPTAESGAATSPPSAGSSVKPRSAGARNFPPLPEVELAHFLSAIGKSKSFYATLANTLCQDEAFAEKKDKQCWNGERIAEYTKTVVDVGLDMQKYNPEVKPNTNIQSVDPKVAGLVDKLRRVHHMAVSSLGPNYADADYMQRDGTEGSGSGNGPDIEDDDREDDYVRGSGSGEGKDEDVAEPDENGRSATDPQSGGARPPTPDQPPTVPRTAGGCPTAPSPLLLSLLVVCGAWALK